MHIHILLAPTQENLQHLKAQLPSEVCITVGPIEGSSTFEILVAGFPSEQDLNASPALHTLIIPWAGLPEATRKLLCDFPNLAVNNLHHNDDAVAETTLALLLSAAKQILPFDQNMRRHDWGPRFDQEHEALLLRGKQALILGYGAIGRRVALLCRALGMTVKATQRSATNPTDDGTGVIVYPPDALHQLLPNTQALLICLPLTASTQGLIGPNEFNLLPSNAVLVNVGRGPIVQEEALFQALQNNQIFGAGIDVWYQYPKLDGDRTHAPPSQFPFHELSNVVMSPHRADHCEGIEPLRMNALATLIHAALEKREIPNRLDLGRGY